MLACLGASGRERLQVADCRPARRDGRLRRRKLRKRISDFGQSAGLMGPVVHRFREDLPVSEQHQLVAGAVPRDGQPPLGKSRLDGVKQRGRSNDIQRGRLDRDECRWF